MSRLAISAGPIELASAPVHIPLKRLPGARVTDLSPERRLFLELHDLRASRPPGVIYDLYLDLPPNSQPEGPQDPHYIGTLNFFAAQRPPGAADFGSRAAVTRSYNVTSVAQKLKEAGLLTEDTLITIAPEAEPETAAKPVITSIELVAQ